MWRQIKQGKYKNKSCFYNGCIYDSKKEAAYAQELDFRKKAKDIKDWARQVKCSLDIFGKHICNYYIDFKIYHKDGSEEMVEVKGFETPVWKLKWRLFEAIWNKEYPGVVLTVVK